MNQDFDMMEVNNSLDRIASAVDKIEHELEMFKFERNNNSAILKKIHEELKLIRAGKKVNWKV